MQINRLFEIVYILLDKKNITARELAKRFEVSVRTIYRDIDTLSSAGIPIYASQGKGGGIALLDDYILNKSVLSENEQNEILFALQGLTVTRNPETDKVLAKLSSLFNKKNKINWIEVDLSPWGSNKNQRGQFAVLKDAILNRQVIEFEYFNTSGEKSSRKVEPVRLSFKVNAWYLHGFCLSKKAYRTFKVSRMSGIRVTQEFFVERLPEELPEAAQEQKSQKWIEVRLKISPHGAYRVFDEFDEKEVTKNQDDSFTVATSLPESKWLTSYILSFGADVEVLAPQYIREMIQNKLEEMIGKYKNKR
ncbi:helix-turn-helix transcriptional regulator [Candidatus Formimonas warabiya]|uniref:Transcriptional regulator n=1 Tax=Formimonas warabiya TaxID=1761012 RepID=A0A3G1KM79_FORW1|nr:YafY family protein [Candidatus Formimonas warabiya]ATW23533.1 transcriptional regulator [Candidatus Formimonas warabiya]